MESKMKCKDALIYKTESQMYKTIYGYQGGEREGINWEIGIIMYPIIYIR